MGFAPNWLLRWLSVRNTNEQLRKRALLLVNQGVQQKAIAGAMGMSEGGFSKWLREDPAMGPVSVTAMDGFEAFVDELATAIGKNPEQETERAPAATAGETFRNGTSSRDTRHPKTGT
jgi:hypothetical protein